MAAPYVWVDGVGTVGNAYGIIAIDGFGMSQPEPRTRLVEVPGRSGSLDLTDAMGGPFYEDRQMTLYMLADGDVWERESSLVSAVHGRRLRFRISADPEHTYVGRWTIKESRRTINAVMLQCDIVCDPYRYRDAVTYRTNPVGGRMYDLPSGDMPVRPTIEAQTPVMVEFGGRETLVPAGTWRLNDVLFVAGVNHLYLNSWQVSVTTWEYVSSGGRHPLTWDKAEMLRWDELEGLSSADGMIARKWDEAEFLTWGDAEELTWDEMEWGGSEPDVPPVDTTVYVRYEIGDL